MSNRLVSEDLSLARMKLHEPIFDADFDTARAAVEKVIITNDKQLWVHGTTMTLVAMQELRRQSPAMSFPAIACYTSSNRTGIVTIRPSSFAVRVRWRFGIASIHDPCTLHVPVYRMEDSRYDLLRAKLWTRYATLERQEKSSRPQHVYSGLLYGTLGALIWKTKARGYVKDFAIGMALGYGCVALQELAVLHGTAKRVAASSSPDERELYRAMGHPSWEWPRIMFPLTYPFRHVAEHMWLRDMQ